MTRVAAFDLLLLIGLTLRVSHLVVRDDLAIWWVHQPLANLASRRGRWREPDLTKGEGQADAVWEAPRWWKYAKALQCFWCIGFWIGVAAIASLQYAGGLGHAAMWWRLVAGAFTLNYVTANINQRL